MGKRSGVCPRRGRPFSRREGWRTDPCYTDESQNPTLREQGRTQQVAGCPIPFIGNVHDRTIHRDPKQMSGFQGLGEAGMGATVNGDGGLLWGDENVFELDRRGGYTSL